ncbi:g6450 [Coccomyxa elongata]
MPAPTSKEGTSGRVIVCDNGTGFVKCGFAGDVSPRAVFPCIVGHPLNGQPQPGKQVFVGHDCTARRHDLDINYPISNGLVQSWEDMQHVWDHTFENILRIDSHARAESRILLTEPPLNPLSNRQRLMETMFETYNFAGAQIQIQAVLTLYAQGLVTGLVVDIGDGVTHIIPVIEGCSFPHLTRRLNVAGRDVTARLVDLLQRRGYALNRSADFDTARALKERLCYVSADCKRELQLARETTCQQQSYTLPDGRTIRLASERFMAPEALFNPSLLDMESPGIAEQVFQCIQDMDVDNRMSLYQHIVLSGGSTMLPGLTTRLERDIRALYLQHVLKGNKDGLRKFKLKIDNPPLREHIVFSGGSILADIMANSDEFWVTRQEWQEDPHRALKKCVRL